MTDSPVILSLDSSAAHCAAALVSRASTARRREEMTRGQAERLMPLAQEVMAEAGVTPRDLTLIAVCTGPGNFTGVRIAVSAARGLALALGIPAAGVSRLHRLAGAAMAEPGATGALVAIPTRRGQVHAELHALDPAVDPEEAGPSDLTLRAAATGAPEAAAEALRPALAGLSGIFATDGAEGLGALLGLPAARWDAEAEAIALAFAAQDMVTAAAARGETLPRPAPVYLRPADAAPSSEKPPALIPG